MPYVKYKKLMDDISNSKEELVKELSRLDKEQEDILHFIENERYSCAVGAKMMKELRRCRNERREVKENLSDAQRISMAITKATERPDRVYTYRTKVVQRVRGEL